MRLQLDDCHQVLAGEHSSAHGRSPCVAAVALGLQKRPAFGLAVVQKQSRDRVAEALTRHGHGLIANVSASILLFLAAASIYGETPPQFLWAHRAEGGSDQAARATAVDPSGNVYLTGFFNGTNSIGSSNLVSSGLEDMFLAKYDSLGNFLWARKAGGTGYDEGLGVATDPAGNVYVTGLFQSTASFGSTNLTSSGQSDIFIAKYNPSGSLLWARKAGGNDFDEAHAIAVDAQGNAYITGYFDANATFGTLTLANASGSDDIFVAKCSSSGDFLWARKAGGSTTNDVGNGIALDGATNVYVTGFFSGSAAFGSTNLTSVGTNGLPDAFLAKYDSAGNLLWVRQAGGSGDDTGNAVAADATGNASVTGQFLSPATFGSTNLTGNGADIFVARYDPAGNLLWVRKAGGNNAIYGDSGLGIASGPSGSVYVCGFFSGNASFSPSNLTSIAFDDVFCTKYDAAGNLAWVRTAGGDNLDVGYALTSDTQSNVFLSGFFASSALAFDGLTLTNSGGRDIFVAKLGIPIVPRLSVTTSNAQILLSWPAGAADFVLQSSDTLSNSANWATVSTTTNFAAITISGPQKFFRLKK